jgi:adenylosuccinate lyase
METVLMQAAERGGDRQELHERIRRHAFQASSRMKEGKTADLVERIAGDDAFGLDEDGIRALLRPERFIGRAPEQVDRFLDEWVGPAIRAHESEAELAVGAPDVRV